MKKGLFWAVAIAGIGVVIACGAMWSRSSKEAASDYRTVQVRRGDLVETISATGTVEPEDLIDVGAQVAGRIVEFGKDRQGREIDYGSEVEAGMILARIDDTVYRADLNQAEAGLSSAKANLERTKADLEQLKAKNDQAQNDWERGRKLGPSDALSQSSYDGYRSAADVAKAALEMGKAAIKQAEAGVAQAQADLNRAKQNLSYCTIVSPIKGVIIDRRVNIGQTVVASLNAPSLFLIAKDLKQVQVWVAVNEADIGSIHPGQKVTFTVDAYPDERFEGRVGKIRLNASMTQNVVTYTVEVVTDNSSGRLLPYLTANLRFETKRSDNALIVPNQALKWSPPGRTGRAGSADRSRIAETGRGERDRRPAGSGASHQGAGTGTLWTLEGNTLKPVRVSLGISDGSETAVSGPDIREGMVVVTGTMTASEISSGSGAQQSSTNPFVPQIPRRGKRN
ncbi:MAG TPA: efflux RND transporter periplasmic adaptor subunit [Deltaproteobacteria bacterium]|nr:efflux RND transporter periplasmic adaptor subunit [Deltaproteobacteria bacterium]